MLYFRRISVATKRFTLIFPGNQTLVIYWNTSKMFTVAFVVSLVFLTSSPVPPPLCPHLELENGHISLDAVTEGGVASFVCQEGFILEGKETLTCEQSGNWSGDVPKCISESYSFLHLELHD